MSVGFASFPGLEEAVKRMCSDIRELLSPAECSIYLHGSLALGDFRPGWSDLDLLCLTDREILPEQAERLCGLRQERLCSEPENPYYRAFEGGLLPLDAFVSGQPARVVYWGTGGQRVTDRYAFDSLSSTVLLEHGILLYGAEVRSRLRKPTYTDLRADLCRHCEATLQYGVRPSRSVYAFGWLLDTARGLYTLRTGTIASKTAAGEWALAEGLCPDPDVLRRAVEVRREPARFLRETREALLDEAETLGPAIGRFAEILWMELNRS